MCVRINTCISTGTHRVQERMLGPQESELQVVVSIQFGYKI